MPATRSGRYSLLCSPLSSDLEEKELPADIYIKSVVELSSSQVVYLASAGIYPGADPASNPADPASNPVSQAHLREQQQLLTQFRQVELIEQHVSSKLAEVQQQMEAYAAQEREVEDQSLAMLREVSRTFPLFLSFLVLCSDSQMNQTIMEGSSYITKDGGNYL